jgi:hypothetical protein
VVELDAALEKQGRDDINGYRDHIIMNRFYAVKQLAWTTAKLGKNIVTRSLLGNDLDILAR